MEFSQWECREHAETSTRGKESIIWRGICGMQLAIVAKNFMWRAYQDLLLAKDNLVRRKIIQDPECPLCGLEAETSYHIL
jgi:hypothetical protein